MKVMKHLDSKGLWGKLEMLAPHKTSPKRFLISKTAKHPNGNEFFVPVKYRNLYMEAHKNYQTAITQLQRLLSRLDIDLTYKGQ